MLKSAVALAAFSLLTGCQESDTKILIGATVVGASGQAPIADGVIVVAGGNIRAVGLRRDVPIPQNSERTDLSGKWVIAVAGSRIAPGEPANLLVLTHAPPGEPTRRMIAGQWQAAH